MVVGSTRSKVSDPPDSLICVLCTCHFTDTLGLLGLRGLIAVMDAKQVEAAVEGSAGDIGAQGGASAGAG